MNKILLFFVFQLLSLSVFSQGYNVELDIISKELSKEIATCFFNKKEDVENWIKGSTNISIQVNHITNSKGQQTMFSKEFSKSLVHGLGLQFNGIIKFANFKITTNYDDNNTVLDNINTIKKSDFILFGQYTYSQNGIYFSLFKLYHIKSKNEIAIKNVNIENPNVEKIKKYYETDLINNSYEKFMNFQKTNSLVKSIDLTNNKKVENKITIVGMGEVFDAKYSTNYNIGINLAKETYIYAFFYDPLDKKNDFIRIIDFENKKYFAGEYLDILPFNLEFYSTQKKEEYSYIKFIFSQSKIDITKYQSTVFDSENQEALIVNKNDCNAFMNFIKTKKDIQTETIILTFK